MYDPQQVKELQKATLNWLNAQSPSANNVEELRNILRFHENRYYVMNDPLVSDFEYDTLYKLLEKFEKEDAGIITPDSPTQRVGAGQIRDFPKTNHLVPMLSLENSYNAEDRLDFYRKARELSGLDTM